MMRGAGAIRCVYLGASRRVARRRCHSVPPAALSHPLEPLVAMPAVAASSRSTTNKENRGTAFALHAERSDDSDADAGAPSSKSRRVVSGSSSSAARRAVSASKGSSSSMPEDKMAALERRLEQVRGEKRPGGPSQRDAVQAEFDSLRELRKTEPERALSEWRRTAESKSRRESVRERSAELR